MSIDRIYREFFGFSLIIFSLFLFGSLITFSYLDTTEDLLIVDKEFKNNFGFLGALFSTNLFFNFGLVSFYLVFILFYFGLLFFFNYSEKDAYLNVLDNINKFLLGLFSVLLACISASAFITADYYNFNYLDINNGGRAGLNLIESMSLFLPKMWLGTISFIFFLLVQYFVFSDIVNALRSFLSPSSKDKEETTVPEVREEHIETSPEPTPSKSIIAKPKEVKKKVVEKPVQREDFIDLLDQKEDMSTEVTEEYLNDLSENLTIKLREFGIEGNVENNLPGPVITRFEISLAPGTKASQVSNIANDLARSLAVKSVRVVEVIEGKSTIGIEIPNPKRQIVSLYSIMKEFKQNELTSLEFCVGRDISGQASKINLQQLPHLLIAGTTGSGKSVGVNTILLNLLRNNDPEKLKLLLIDPKMLELSVYDDIPHLITPVITDMQKASNGLNWCVKEMDKRYKLMSILGVRSLEGFNEKVSNLSSIPDDVRQQLEEENQAEIKELPYIVVVIDELADLMMVTGKKVEQLIARLAQKARASGIHLAIATQRPSVDVITGLIKANIPSRMSFLVSSKVDSRTILDQGGAEQLLGKGDMLFIEPGTSIPKRIHGAFVSDGEVQRVAKKMRELGQPTYIEEVIKSPELIENLEDSDGDDELYNQAVEFVVETRRASISSVQRKFRIGYNRAARLIETMEENGIVSPMNSNGSREVL
ncbi:DNA translocase FtsK 4TM domain-containing protein [SAR86 cluster bacterium]|uniref:DNA translocase FtsK n=1 Tax=SAR86 cluster bacterium TaxID=2030880 RepID=A0A9Q8X2F9_9GAMM|nr:DNA translocase FtsK 4TM domain-containing protein [SAR86 cluster bacterium]